MLASTIFDWLTYQEKEFAWVSLWADADVADIDAGQQTGERRSFDRLPAA
jgi:hypothetical protein